MAFWGPWAPGEGGKELKVRKWFRKEVENRPYLYKYKKRPAPGTSWRIEPRLDFYPHWPRCTLTDHLWQTWIIHIYHNVAEQLPCMPLLPLLLFPPRELHKKRRELMFTVLATALSICRDPTLSLSAQKAQWIKYYFPNFRDEKNNSPKSLSKFPKTQN